MPEANRPYILIAMTSEERGEGLRGVAHDLGLASEVFTDVEALLYHTRGAVPEALVIEHSLVRQVPQLDLISLLRRRKALAEVPFVYLYTSPSPRDRTR